VLGLGGGPEIKRRTLLGRQRVPELHQTVRASGSAGSRGLLVIKQPRRAR
jgi:hypothetical protein